MAQYWMHLSAAVEAPLKRLDAFLRRFWLECCGHLSSFTIGRQQYMSDGALEFGEQGMTSARQRNSPSEWSLRDHTAQRQSIELMARNDAPQAACQRCKREPAIEMCAYCTSEDSEAWLCSVCAAIHECVPEGRLPVINSPRVGVCGYLG